MPADRAHPPDVPPPTTSAGRGRGGRGRGRGGRGRTGRATELGGRRYWGVDDDFGGLGRTRHVSYEPYEPPLYAGEVLLEFRGNPRSHDDEIDVTVLDAPRRRPIKSIHFGPEFSIKDRHLQLLAARPRIMASLRSLALGDSDTGNGGDLTEQGVEAFLAAAPNLRVLSLDACNRLTDMTLIKALESCPLLEMVNLTGHDKFPGEVKGPAIQELKNRKTLGRHLKSLSLLDQHIDSEEVKKMTRMRKGLAVTLGDTGERFGSPFITWYGGHVVRNSVI